MKAGWKIRLHLLFLVALVALPLIALMAHNVYREFGEARHEAAANAMKLAQITAVQASQLVSETKAMLAALSQRPQIRALDSRQCDPLFKGFLDLHPRFQNLLTVDAAGNIVCSTVTPPAGTTKIPPDVWLRELVRTGKFTISKVTQGVITGKWVVALAYPLHDEAGKLAGAVALPINLAKFQPLVTQATLVPGTTARIIGRDGVVIAGSNLTDPGQPDKWTAKDIRGTGIVDIVLARKQGEARSTGSDGVERFYGFRPVPGTDWYAYAGIPVSVAFANVYADALQNVTVGTVMLLLAITLAVFAARMLDRPLRALAESARKVARGDRNTRFLLDGPAEIVAIAEQFNLTLDALARDERRRIESQSRLAEVVATVAEGIISIDERQRIVFFNPGAERMFGRSAAALNGQPLGALVPERFRASHDEHIRKFAATGETSRAMGKYGLIYGLRASGEEFPVEATVSQSGTSPNKLLTVILRDVTERMRTEQAFRDYAEQLHQLSRRLFETEENERRRLARELHDRVGQNVTALSLNLNLVRSELPADVSQKMSSRLKDCESLLYSTAQLVRDIQVDLRPPGLDELGLVAALNAHARQVAGRIGAKIVVSGTEITPRLPPATEITLFRIAQEALNNIAKHAHATEVTIAVDASPAAVVVTVTDNGCGFDAAARPAQPTRSLGMVNMRERAETIGGTLRVESAPGQGTRVIIEAPRVAPGAT